MKTAAAHQRILRTVPRMTGGAGLAIIAGLVLGLAGTSMAAEPKATLPSAAADHTSPRRLAFEKKAVNEGAFNRSSQHHGLSLESGRDGCGDENGGGT